MHKFSRKFKMKHNKKNVQNMNAKNMVDLNGSPICTVAFSTEKIILESKQFHFASMKCSITRITEHVHEKL